MWVVREGYEGLVRGNTEYYAQTREGCPTTAVSVSGDNFLNNLRFGDGNLLRNGACDQTGGRTLSGRYIVRVGFDDVRGWFAEVSFTFVVLCFLLIFDDLGRYSHWNSAIKGVPYT